MNCSGGLLDKRTGNLGCFPQQQQGTLGHRFIFWIWFLPRESSFLVALPMVTLATHKGCWDHMLVSFCEPPPPNLTQTSHPQDTFHPKDSPSTTERPEVGPCHEAS